MDFHRALFDRLSGDSALTTQLAPYGAGRAIFDDVPPADFDLAAGPCIVLGPVTVNGDRDTFTEQMRDAEIDVRAYAKATGSTLALDQIAERIRARLHRAELAFGGGATGRARVSGPVAAPTSEPDAIGRRLSVRVLA